MTNFDSRTEDAATRASLLVRADCYLRRNLVWGPSPRSDIICSWDDALADAQVDANDWLSIGSQQVRPYCEDDFVGYHWSFPPAPSRLALIEYDNAPMPVRRSSAEWAHRRCACLWSSARPNGENAAWHGNYTG